jgi:hypothetical protein
MQFCQDFMTVSGNDTFHPQLTGIVQETPGFVTYDDLSEAVQIIIFCTDEIITDPHAVPLFLCQHFWYTLADVKHLHTLAEDGMATTNQNSERL